MGVLVRASTPVPASGSNSSSLAMVVDKRPPHRPGGCVGIFFQLFDWNRRLANRKFFSRKLLPQVRAAKKISKKFAGDERMSAAKLLLIADENRGGFPSTKRAEACGAARTSPIHSARFPPSYTISFTFFFFEKVCSVISRGLPGEERRRRFLRANDVVSAARSPSGSPFGDGVRGGRLLLRVGRSIAGKKKGGRLPTPIWKRRPLSIGEDEQCYVALFISFSP